MVAITVAIIVAVRVKRAMVAIMVAIIVAVRVKGL